MKKYVDGVLVDLSAEEISDFNKRLAEIPSKFDRALKDLRERRNNKLAETDFYALSDVTMSPEMETYRQELRDITEGLTTVEDVEAVVFPTKP
tara:strand:- start:1022 stop:1300 length:279 start_codon:yes stop_codon:yes gene_type:complete